MVEVGGQGLQKHVRAARRSRSMLAIHLLPCTVCSIPVVLLAVCPQAQTVHSDIEQQWQVSLSTPTLSSSSSTGPLEAMQQLQQIFSAAAQLAAGRMVHLFLNWWSMALTSQSRWYGDNIHPVFLLVGDANLQQKLAARGCEGVTEAAAAAGRLLEVAAAAGSSSSSSSSGVLQAVEDLQAVVRFVTSLEEVMWSDSSSSSSNSSNGATLGSSGSSIAGSQVMHWLADPSIAAAAVVGQEGFSELLPEGAAVAHQWHLAVLLSCPQVCPQGIGWVGQPGCASLACAPG